MPGYYEVYLKVALEELRQSDPKGIYERFDSGELSNVAGLDLPFDEPKSPDWIVAFNPRKPVEYLTKTLLEKLSTINII